MDEGKKYLAELLGTFVLVFIGTGSAVVAGTYIGFLGIALAFARWATRRAAGTSVRAPICGQRALRGDALAALVLSGANA